jgi:hypothetical protein
LGASGGGTAAARSTALKTAGPVTPVGDRHLPPPPKVVNNVKEEFSGLKTLVIFTYQQLLVKTFFQSMVGWPSG